ncbi:MAG: peptidoglycan-associated lipoprotein Pal [Halorhodospira sp.]
MSTTGTAPTTLDRLRMLGAAAGLGLLAGCASWTEGQGEMDEDQAEEVEGSEVATGETDDSSEADAEGLSEAEQERARSQGLDPEDPLDAAVLEDPESPLATRRIHFGFDDSAIRDEYVPVLEAHGAFLAEHPEEELTIEGHTDERGSREYNLALGERRAESVEQMLRAHGAQPGQLDIVSYGEEKPLVDKSNDEAWAENRRAELIYED